MNETPIKFGTDGWRAVIGDGFTNHNVDRVAQAYADYVSGLPYEAGSERSRRIVVGYDRRFLSDVFAERAAAIMAGNGFEIERFSDAVPTPLVSWAVRETGAAGGVLITASHNPAIFNGFKIKAPFGGSASPDMTAAVEKLVDANPPKRAELDEAPEPASLTEATAGYRKQIEDYVDVEKIRSVDATIIVDPMHGSGGRWVESFLQGGKLRVETIRGDRDPLFGGVNPEPIDQNIGALRQRVKETVALAGVATDGDADRLGAVNELGETMTMHEVVPLMLLHLIRDRGKTGGIVRTFSQSVLLPRIAAAFGLPIHETPIGFKYVADLMLTQDILIGAEESGGIGVKDHIPERDGVLNSLLFLEAIIASGKTPSEMVREMHREFGEFYFGRIDEKCPVAVGKALAERIAKTPPAKLAEYAVKDVSDLDGTKLIFDDESWILFRPSGTEPMLRIYSEATSRAKVHELLKAGAALAASS